MEHLPWFSNPGIIDYHAHLELSELEKEFEDPAHVFLVAKKRNGEITGALNFAFLEQYAKNGVMMPAVPLAYRSTGAAAALLQTQERILLEREIPVIEAVLKYRSEDTVGWYVEQLTRADFKPVGPESVQMLAHLFNNEALSPEKGDDVEIVDREGFTVDDFAEFTMRAYASTSSDRRIHGYDELVTSLVAAKNVHQMIMDGGFGSSPSTFWRVAVVRGKPAGYIYGFVPRVTWEVNVGVIGNLGVFPEFRGMGLGVILVKDILKRFLKAGIAYSMVGTPANNAHAIATYSKTGFEIVNRIRKFRKTVDT